MLRELSLSQFVVALYFRDGWHEAESVYTQCLLLFLILSALNLSAAAREWHGAASCDSRKTGVYVLLRVYTHFGKRERYGSFKIDALHSKVGGGGSMESYIQRDRLLYFAATAGYMGEQACVVHTRHSGERA